MEIDLKDLLLGLIKKWYWLVVGLILGAVLGYAAYTTDAAPTYTSTAMLEVVAEDTGIPSDSIGNDIAKLNYEHALIATVLDVINSDKNLDKVAARVAQIYAEENAEREARGEEAYAVPTVTRGTIRGAVSATGGGESKTLFITVKVTTANKADAIAFINAYIDEAKAATDTLAHDIELNISDDMRPTFSAIDNDVTVNEPSGKKSIIIGAVIGFALCAVVVLLAFGMDKRVKSEEEISDRYGLPVLAVLPEVASRRER